MSYLILKYVHILSAVVLFGTGAGSAFYKFMTDWRGEVAAIASTNRLVVLADWIFTTPTVIIQPLTGIALMHILHISWANPWIWLVFGLYILAGACWLPVVWLQLRMRDMSDVALQNGQALPALYWTYARIWFWLGVPAFLAMLIVLGLMVFRLVVFSV